MPVYEYKCEAGHRHAWNISMEDRDAFIGLPCLASVGEMFRCEFPLKRVFSFSTPRIIHAHFNPTVGKEVSSMRGFKDDLKRASEDAERRTGVPHDFQPVDLGEVGKETVTEEGMRETHDRWKKING